jgi:hypothetical protein
VLARYLAAKPGRSFAIKRRGFLGTAYALGLTVPHKTVAEPH